MKKTRREDSDERVWRLAYPEIVPYVRTTQRQKWVDPRYKRYAAWKKAFRLAANVEQFPDELDRDGKYAVTLVLSWTKRARCDLDNAVKGALDALFAQDRRVVSIIANAIENQSFDGIALQLERLR